MLEKKYYEAYTLKDALEVIKELSNKNKQIMNQEEEEEEITYCYCGDEIEEGQRFCSKECAKHYFSEIT